MRLCIDYRRLNAKTIRDQFRLPRVKESIDAISNAKLSSTMDLTSGFNQVVMDEEDRQKTAFTTPSKGLCLLVGMITYFKYCSCT